LNWGLSRWNELKRTKRAWSSIRPIPEYLEKALARAAFFAGAEERYGQSGAIKKRFKERMFIFARGGIRQERAEPAMRRSFTGRGSNGGEKPMGGEGNSANFAGLKSKVENGLLTGLPGGRG